MSKKKRRKPKKSPWRRVVTFLLLFVPIYYVLGYIRQERKGGAVEHTSEQSALENDSPKAKRQPLLELPRRSKGDQSLFVTHYVDDRVNYSLEYDTEKRHARWVAFSFDDRTSQDNVHRSDAWRWDPKIPTRYSTESWFRGSGYSRGHLVASEDRAYSQEANEQTFYYSNISPQLQEHNGGIWVRIEKKIRAWGRDAAFRDVLYVAKGGTIRDDQIESKRIKGKMVVPRYYWAALLLEKDGEYHSIAFLTEHRAYERGQERLRDLALSVDALEEFTGLDFFHNLPDDVERRVEAEDPNARLARTIWWN